MEPHKAEKLQYDKEYHHSSKVAGYSMGKYLYQS